ncbi:MAG: LexA repressor [Alphaproteobacteria bacterium MarineAlpha5_Bin12]|nr:MAG: LexA repressor [Alphaproteobacteria bacterium MarineAlpha5_Bin12]|tara:strand:+ start:52580 stop:53215 length:636 start_codon:yes stop_codon:yes gene_type:complete
MLTKKQKILFDYLDKYIDGSGISPSFEEMKQALGLKSKSGIHRLITSLEERGYIRRIKHKARAMEIVKNQKESSEKYENFKNQNTLIPLLGSIPAGTPVEPGESDLEKIEIPNNMLSKNHNYFGLIVKGESMIDEGIMDGDTAIIRQAKNISNGRIAAVLVKGNEVTLKKIKFDQSKIRLIPANSSFKEMEYKHSDIEIQGELKGILRKYN